MHANYKIEELCFILEGAFSLYHPNGRIFKQKGLVPAINLKQSFNFGAYLASINLFLNAHQQEDYENCVNQDVI